MKKLFLILTLLVTIGANAQIKISGMTQWNASPAGVYIPIVTNNLNYRITYETLSQLLVRYADTASLVAPYLRKFDTASLSKRIDANSASIVTNSANIASNSTAISSNTSAISLKQDIIYTTITALRAMTSPSSTIRYYTTDAGQEGFWYYASSDITSADNTGTILVSTNSKRFKRIVSGDIYASWFGAKGDSVNSDDVPINAALSYASYQGGGIVRLLPGKYKTTASIALLNNTQLIGSGENCILYQNSNSSVLRTDGVLGTAFALTSNVSVTDTAVFTSLTPTEINVGDWIIIRDESIWRGNSYGNKVGQITQVKAIDYTNKKITINGSIFQTYLMSNTATVQKITPVSEAQVLNLRIENPAPMTRTSALNTFNYAYHLTLNNVSMKGSDEAGFDLRNCWESNVLNCRMGDFTDDQATNREGYGVLVSGACYNVLVDHCQFRKLRHAFSTGGATIYYGVPRTITVSNCNSSLSSSAHYDTHEPGEDIRFINCIAYGSEDYNGSINSVGFQIRNWSATLENCTAHQTNFSGFFIQHNSIVTHVLLSGCTAYKTRNGDGFQIDETVQMIGCKSLENDRHGVWFTAGAAFGPSLVSGCVFQDNDKSTGFSASGVEIDNMAKGITFTNCIFENSASNSNGQRYGIKSTGTTTGINIFGCTFSNNFTASASLVGSNVAQNNTLPSGDVSLNDGSTYAAYPTQSKAPVIPATGYNLFDSSGLAWVRPDGFRRLFDATSLTANRKWTLPDATGTVSLLEKAETLTGVKTFAPAVTASSALAVGMTLSPTLTAAANSDNLTAYDISPTYTVGAFTGVTTNALRVKGSIIPSANGTYFLGSSSATWNTIYSGTFAGSAAVTVKSGTSSNLLINVGSTQYGEFVGATGNLMIQNGGTFTDNGARLQNGGSLSLGTSTQSGATVTLDNTATNWVNTGAATTWTLPALAAHTGWTYTIYNRGSGAITLSRAGTDNLYKAGSVTTTTIAAGTGAIVFNDGSFWIVTLTN